MKNLSVPYMGHLARKVQSILLSSSSVLYLTEILILYLPAVYITYRLNIYKQWTYQKPASLQIQKKKFYFNLLDRIHMNINELLFTYLFLEMIFVRILSQVTYVNERLYVALVLCSNCLTLCHLQILLRQIFIALKIISISMMTLISLLKLITMIMMYQTLLRSNIISKHQLMQYWD